jgi:hypothetical protein
VLPLNAYLKEDPAKSADMLSIDALAWIAENGRSPKTVTVK